jgi:hypothetical protein
MSAIAAINPAEVVVVYNSNTEWSPVSQAVADYYCAARNIPSSNKIGLDIPLPGQQMYPFQFMQFIKTPLENQLQTLGVDPNNPASDPIKAILLCYGVPMRIAGNERVSSVDSALTLLFNSTAWGLEPISAYDSGISISNPYFSDNAPDPANRTKPADFGEFRETFTGTIITPPYFKIVRMFNNTHAIAAGSKGILYKGALTNGIWGWTAIDDITKQFICHDVSDICLADQSQYPGYAWACTNNSGSIIKTTDHGASWSAVIAGATYILKYPLTISHIDDIVQS